MGNKTSCDASIRREKLARALIDDYVLAHRRGTLAGQTNRFGSGPL
jgi:hypothetical protein